MKKEIKLPPHLQKLIDDPKTEKLWQELLSKNKGYTIKKIDCSELL